MPTKTITVEDLLAGSDIATLAVGDVVEGTVIAVDSHEIWLDLGARGTGLVIGREIDQTDGINVGDSISASVPRSSPERWRSICR